MFLATEYLSSRDSVLSPTPRHGKCSQERLRWDNPRLEKDEISLTDNLDTRGQNVILTGSQITTVTQTHHLV